MTFALTGVRVVDAGNRLASAYCSKVLADLGADVVLVEPPGGSPLRRWSAVGEAGRDGNPDGALFRFLSSGKRSVVGDDTSAYDLAAEADIVLGLSAAEVHRRNPHAVVV